MDRIQLSVAVLVLLSGAVMAQTPDSETQLTIVKLQAPNYPAMALAARVWGEVHLSVKLAADGTAASVTVDSGPPMLRQAAAESARGSRFQPVREDQVGHVYQLSYRFSLEFLGCDQARDQSYPRVKFESNTVAISEQVPPLCDPGAEVRVRVRSAKCLFLWKCGLKTP
jgi:TonB family protein